MLFPNNKKPILIGIGSGISQCHFEVERDLVQKLCDRTIFAQGIILNWLKNKYFSYRREKFKKIRTMLAIIGQK